MPDENDEQSQILDEEQMGESFEDRANLERPDDLGSDEGPVGTLVAPGGDLGVDDVAEEVAHEIAPRQRRDQLDAGDPGIGSELRDFAAEREEVLPAEEAAMHLTDPPPMGDGDGYVDD